MTYMTYMFGLNLINSANYGIALHFPPPIHPHAHL